MIQEGNKKGPDEGTSEPIACFSTTLCLTPDQKSMIAQRTVTVLKRKDKIPGEVGEGGKSQKVRFSKPVRDEVDPLIEEGATLDVGGFNSKHETIHERGSFINNRVDPLLSKWNISFRWFCKMVAEISGIQSRGSWNNHRTIYRAFGDHLKTDPDVRALSERKLLICAKHDDPLAFVRTHRDLISKSQAELEELVTGKKREKTEPTPDRHYRNLGVRAFSNDEKEFLNLTGITPDLREAIYDVLEGRENAAQDMDNALSTILDDGSLDWTGYWQDTAHNSEITINYTAGTVQYTFWDPEKGRIPYETWSEVVEAIRAESPEVFVIVAEGPVHKIAETSLAGTEPQTYVTILKELLEQLPRKDGNYQESGSSEEPDQAITTAESSEREDDEDHASPDEDEILAPEDRETNDEPSGEGSRVESGEEENDWSPGEGWTEHRGSLDLRQAFGTVMTNERWVNVHASLSGEIADGKEVDVHYQTDIPRTWPDLIGYLESEAFAPYREAKLVWFTNEEEKPYLYAMNGNGWKVWSNVSAIPLSN